jgi:dTDP-4-amino-4,6-dideoxy-D-galactose acyltransferase
MVTCHKNNQDRARIGLVGVAADQQGKGVGRSLVFGALAWFHKAGSKEVEVATQGRNLEAQRLYQRCGFLTSRVSVWYHKWFT